MKFTYNWLKEYVELDLSPAQLADRLTMLGLEVDSVEDIFQNLAGVVIARILEVSPHPDADRLTVCRVAAGNEKELTVVCGAPNVRPQMLTAIALPGCCLPSGLEVKATKIRGVHSAGMLCSEKDLAISEEHAGIMDLPSDLTVGTSLASALSLADTLIEVDLTPNRPDCASVLGIAREAAGFSGKKLRPPVQAPLPELNGNDLPFTVTVAAEQDCPRYAARLLQGVRVAPSPLWLRLRLRAVGVRPINNVVDITNFVMLEYGQPLHAFDYRKLAGGRIVVRRAGAGEKFVTLDGNARDLDPEMLLICDAEKAVAVAGVMGGENSEVSPGTTEVLLESAYFNPVSIRKTSRKLNLATDASYRFERGIDPLGTTMALERAVRLIEEICGAKAVAGGVDRLAAMIQAPAPITLRVERANKLLGTDLSLDRIAMLLASIEMGVEKKSDTELRVCPPSFRVDLEREIDLVEEVARLIGFNEIPSSLPQVPMSFPERQPDRDLRRQLGRCLTALGFYEAINYSFTAEKNLDHMGLAADHEARALVRLLNPLGADQGVMRTSLLPGLLENVCQNVSRQNPDVKLFEIGKVFFHRQGREQPDEQQHLAAVLSGRRNPAAPLIHFPAAPADLADVKGAADMILAELRLDQVEFVLGKDVSFAATDNHILLRAAGRTIGSLGQFDRNVLKNFGIKQDVFFLDLNLDELCRLPATQKTFQPLPRYPAVKWDIALLVPEEVAVGHILKSITAFDHSLVEAAELFDLYRGKPIEAGYKSVAISITYRSSEHTLDDREVGRLHEKILDMLLTRFQGKLREA